MSLNASTYTYCLTSMRVLRYLQQTLFLANDLFSAMRSISEVNGTAGIKVVASKIIITLIFFVLEIDTVSV